MHKWFFSALFSAALFVLALPLAAGAQESTAEETTLRLNDAGRDGIAEVKAMQEVLAATGAKTKILMASIRDVQSMVALARRGVDCFTIGPPVAEAFFAEHLTAAAVAAFEEAAREMST